MNKDTFGSGSISSQGGFKSSTPQERFAQQIDRDLGRKSQRLSQSSIRALIADDTKQWANSIYGQKLAQNTANNASAQQTASATFATTQTSKTSIPSEGGTSITMVGNTGSASASSDTLGRLPQGAIPKEITICENGEPAQYWLVFWEENPLPTTQPI